MLQPATRNALNRLLQIHCRSFPQYARYARPHTPAGSEDKLQTLEQIAEDQQVMSERIAAILRDAEETPYTGRFPMEFTDMHDLSIDYVIKEATRYQRQDLAAMEECLKALRGSPAAIALAEEAVGMAHGHVQSLEELAPATNGAIASRKAGVA